MPEKWSWSDLQVVLEKSNKRKHQKQTAIWCLKWIITIWAFSTRYHISTFFILMHNLYSTENIGEKNLYDIINVSFECMNNIREHHVFNNESKYSMGHSKRYLLEDGPFSSSIAHSGLCRAHSRSYNARCVQDDGSPWA